MILEFKLLLEDARMSSASSKNQWVNLVLLAWGDKYVLHWTETCVCRAGATAINGFGVQIRDWPQMLEVKFEYIHKFNYENRLIYKFFLSQRRRLLDLPLSTVFPPFLHSAPLRLPAIRMTKWSDSIRISSPHLQYHRWYLHSGSKEQVLDSNPWRLL